MEIKIFENTEFGEIRTATNENGDPLFCLTDLCTALELTNTTVVAKRLEADERSKLNLGRQGETIFVTEPGMYSVIIRSDSPKATPMRRWITHEVLPSIRKHGAYLTDNALDNIIKDPEFGIKLLTNLKEERQRREIAEQKAALQENQIKEAAPKLKYYDDVLQSNSVYNTNQIAKELGMSAKTLNVHLKNMRIQYKQGGQWLLYSKYQSKEYTKAKTYTFTNAMGHTQTSSQTVWTEKGRQFIHNLFK